MEKPIVVAVSGGFDPIHIGHVRMFREAKKLGDELVVILNNDDWLVNKKGFVFMHEIERKEIIEAIKGVDRVVVSDHTLGDPDRSVNRMFQELKPDIFANGGDRKPHGDPPPEVGVCKELGIKIVYDIGAGGKVQSSSWLVKKVAKSPPDTTKHKRKLHRTRKAV